MGLQSQALINCPLSDAQFSMLKEEVNPLAVCDDYGISLFGRTKDLVARCLSI